MVFYIVIFHITPWSTLLGHGKKQTSIYKIQTTKAETPKIPISDIHITNSDLHMKFLVERSIL